MANSRAWIVQLTVQTAAVRGGTGTLVHEGPGGPWRPRGSQAACRLQLCWGAVD